MGAEGFLRARLKTEMDLEDFIEMYEGETGNDPVDIDRDSFLVEVNVFSYGDMEVFKEFLRERDAEILEDDIDDGDN